MATKPSDIVRALISAIEAIDVSDDRSTSRDRFRGLSRNESPSHHADRMFVATCPGPRIAEVACQTQFEVDIDLTIYYRDTPHTGDVYFRIMDDQLKIEKALMVGTDFRGPSNPAILDVDAGEPSDPSEVDEGLLAVSRGVTVRFDETL